MNDKFFGGSEPAMIDYMIWPWFELLPALKEYGFVLNANGNLPKLAAWCQAMLANDAVAKTKVSDEIIQKYVNTMQQGNTNYDVE